MGALLLCLSSAAAARTADAGEAASVEVFTEGIVHAPLASVRAVLLDLEGFGEWFPALAEWRVLSRDADSARVYGRQALPWPLADRDYVVRYRWWQTAAGGLVLEALAEPEPSEPRAAGVVRMAVLYSRWELQPHGARTRAQYRFRGDPGGSLPGWVARAGWERRASRVIDALAGEVERRRGSAARSQAAMRCARARRLSGADPSALLFAMT